MHFFDGISTAFMYLAAIATVIAFFSIVNWIIRKLAAVMVVTMILGVIAAFLLCAFGKFGFVGGTDTEKKKDKVAPVHKEVSYDFSLESLDDLPDKIQEMLD